MHWILSHLQESWSERASWKKSSAFVKIEGFLQKVWPEAECISSHLIVVLPKNKTNHHPWTSRSRLLQTCAGTLSDRRRVVFKGLNCFSVSYEQIAVSFCSGLCSPSATWTWEKNVRMYSSSFCLKSAMCLVFFFFFNYWFVRFFARLITKNHSVMFKKRKKKSVQ